jgi:hypothetical protein
METRKSDVPLQYDQQIEIPEFLAKKGITSIEIPEIDLCKTPDVSKLFCFLFKDELLETLSK